MNNELINNLQSIEDLFTAISNEIEKGKINLNSVLENQKTISFWNIGNLIFQHISLLNTHKEKYSQYIIVKLSEKFDIGRRSLYHAINFFNSYPDISSVPKNLSWSHFKILNSVDSDEKKREYERILAEKKLNVRDFYTLVKKDKTDIC